MSIEKKIADRSAIVGVIGLGYVGLPLLQAFHRAGFRVLGIDVDPSKIELLLRGENYLKHLGPDLVADMQRAGRFDASSDLSRMAEADALIVCVPTPLGAHLEPDLSYVEKTADSIAAVLRPGQLISLESTTYPGTTREILLPRLERRGLKCGTDFFLAYSPEREDPGRKDHDTQSIPKLVGGIDPRSGQVAVALYESAIKQVVPVSTAEVAEAAKILENVYRAVNIALVNEMKVVLSAMDIDVWEVVDAAKTKPFGFQAFYPGPGLGGHCIPIDPYYLAWKAKGLGHTTRFIELAGEVNRGMPEYVVQRVAHALNRAGKAVNGSSILVLGLAYKPDVDDVRESPSFELITRFKQLGANVAYNDPHVPHTHAMRHYPHLSPMQSVPIDAESLSGYDCVVIATDHSTYDWPQITQHAPLIVDTRRAIRGDRGDAHGVVRA